MNSIVAYPERGKGGSSAWRGNCAPQLISDIIDQYHLTSINDFMCGSGTTGAAAAQAGIPCAMYDLHSGFNMLDMDIPIRSENIFWHPPYWDIIQYAGKQYSADAVSARYGYDTIAADLSKSQPWEAFVREMNACMMKQFRSLEKGGRMFTLVGDIKKRGKLYSMILELLKPGTLEQIIIKAQYNCCSDRQQYASRNFVPIKHEYLLVLRKDACVAIPVLHTKSMRHDLRDSQYATWRDVIASVIEEKGAMTLQELYRDVEPHRKAQSYAHYKEKIRQTLYINPQVFAQEKDKWTVLKRQGAPIAMPRAQKKAV